MRRRLTAIGGYQPYTWTATGLPPGLSLNSLTGAMSGTPTAPGEFAVSRRRSDNTLPDKLTDRATSTMSIAPATLAITSVRTASDFGNSSTFASGSWLEIKGALLSTKTRTWATWIQRRRCADQSDGVSVTVNGKPAFVYYISPTQINIQAPADPATGPVQIVVTGPSGTTSRSAQKENLAPGMLAPASFKIGGRQYLCAHFNDGVYVGKENLISGVAFRPARPGNTIVAYGTGFGDVVRQARRGLRSRRQTRWRTPSVFDLAPPRPT